MSALEEHRVHTGGSKAKCEWEKTSLVVPSPVVTCLSLKAHAVLIHRAKA